MLLTTKNAHQYVGKTLDCKKKKRFFHHYPLKVVKRKDITGKDRYYYIDVTGTMMYVPDETDTFNSVYFDTVEEIEA